MLVSSATGTPSGFSQSSAEILRRAELSTAGTPDAFWAYSVKRCCARLTFDRTVEMLRKYVNLYGVIPYSGAVAIASVASETGRAELSWHWFSMAVCVNPERYEATHNLGLVVPSGSAQIKFISRARLLFWATVLNPVSERIAADYLYERYRCCDLKAAEALLAAGENSIDTVVLSHASMVAVELQKAPRAAYLMNKAVALSPGDFMTFSKKAITAFAVGDTASAEADLRRSIRINPVALEPAINFGRVLELKGELRKALTVYKDALCQRPDLAEPRLNAAILLLGHGDYSVGWDWYESRWRANAIVTAGRDKLSAQLVTSKPVFDRHRRDRVLVWAEQGLGDELMFASMFPDVLADAASVVAQIDVRLMSLFKRSFPSIEFYKRIRPIDEALYDSQIAMGSLGRIYRRSLDAFATVSHPYLISDSDLSRQFRRRIDSDRKVIGISWSTGNPDNGHYRSLDLSRLCKVFLNRPVHLINLQYKYDLADVKAVEGELGVSLVTFPDVDNFAQIDRLAALMSACDLVISIGNATAHLAAALGRPTWVLTPASGSWRWMFDGAKTPWYPSVRVFRQTRQGDWRNVLHELSGELDRFLKSQ